MKINVLVTGIGGGGHGEQILKALQMSSLDLKIFGADMTEISRGLHRVENKIILPPAKDSRYIEVLLEECKKHDIKVLFHGSEPELIRMSDNRDAIREAGILLPINSKEVLDICMDKNKTMKFLKEKGIPFPKYFKINHIKDIEHINIFPVVLKPSKGGGGSSNTLIVQNKEELLFYSTFLLSQYDEFIAQEYIGTPDSEFTVGVLSDMDGKIINSIAVHRMIEGSLGCRSKVPNFSGRKELGEQLVISSGISQGHIGKYKEVTEQCEKISLALESKGPLNIQCRFVDNKVFVFEINPRYSGTTSFRAMVGLNEPEIMIKYHYLNEAIERFFSYEEGYILRGLDEIFMKDV
jgi:carbamoyl-phosphate synthase large subunit